MGLYDRLQIPDARGGRANLRVTWHPEQRTFAFSLWRDGICVGTIPIRLSDVPALISMLAYALSEATGDANRDGPRSRWSGMTTRLREWVRPKLAPVAHLPVEPSDDPPA
jgi:hypothetical protein